MKGRIAQDVVECRIRRAPLFVQERPQRCGTCGTRGTPETYSTPLVSFCRRWLLPSALLPLAPIVEPPLDGGRPTPSFIGEERRRHMFLASLSHFRQNWMYSGEVLWLAAVELVSSNCNPLDYHRFLRLKDAELYCTCSQQAEGYSPPRCKTNEIASSP